MKLEKPKWYDKTIFVIDFSKPITYAIMFAISMLTLYALLSIEKVNNFEKLTNIEKRLTETCFAYNRDCDHDLGGCICEVKAGPSTVNYIMNK